MLILDGYLENVNMEGDIVGKKFIKNKKIPIKMLIGNIEHPKIVQGTAIVTNDECGKTLTLSDGFAQMTIGV